MGGNTTFPPELYGEIISHVPNRQDLISLSVTSRTLQCEAETILWRRIDIPSPGYHHDHIGYLSVLPRVARYIHSLHIYVDDYSLADLLHDALQAAINLKTLEISCSNRSEVVAGTKCYLGYLCQGATFKLHRLLSCLPITPSCKPFFCSQTELVDLDYSCDPRFFYNVFTSPNVLPALKNIMTQKTHVIEALLPGRNVTHLGWLSNGLQPAGGPFLTVKVLFISPQGIPPSHTSLTFPNVETIAVLQMQNSDIIEVVHGFSLLKLAKILFPPSGIDSYQSSAQFASLLFKSNPILETVEVSYWTDDDERHRRWILKRGCNLEESDPSAYTKLTQNDPDMSDHGWKAW